MIATEWINGFECCQGATAAAGTPGSGIVLVGSEIGPGLQIMNNEASGSRRNGPFLSARTLTFCPHPHLCART